MNEIELLKREIEDLKRWKASMEASHSLPLNVDQAISGRGFLKVITATGILKATGGLLSGISPLSGTKVYYVADISGGTVNRKLTFSDGILISESP